MPSEGINHNRFCFVLFRTFVFVGADDLCVYPVFGLKQILNFRCLIFDLKKGDDSKLTIRDFLKARIVGDNRAYQMAGGGVMKSVGGVKAQVGYSLEGLAVEGWVNWFKRAKLG